MAAGSKSNWVSFFAGGVFTIFVLVLGIFLEPMKTWVDTTFWSPNIIIEFEQQPPYFFLNKLGVQKQAGSGGPVGEQTFDSFYSRFRIKNDSTYRTVHKCRVQLTGIWHRDNDGNEYREKRFEPVELEWTGNEPVDLAPEAEIFGYLVRVSEVAYQKEQETHLSGNPDSPQLRPLFQRSIPRWMSSHLEPGKHKLLVSVYFEDRSPVRQYFEIEWSGKWALDEISMKRELKVKMIR